MDTFFEKDPRVLIVTGSDEKYKSIAALSLPSKREYAEKHGYAVYDYPMRYLERPASWYKIQALLMAMIIYPGTEWFFWIDTDAIIRNQNFSIEGLLTRAKAKDSQIIITRDEVNINAGVFLIRRGAWSERLLEETWAQEDLINDTYWEQTALSRVLTQRDDWHEVLEVDKRILNSYWGQDYEQGDFILHLAGFGRTPGRLEEALRYFTGPGKHV